MTRALIAARKSTKVRKDPKGAVRAGGMEGHSLHTQDERAREFCERMGWNVVDVAKDTISGRVAPIDRKSLGRWLAEPHLFDVIVAYRTDRLSRGSQEDWTRIEHWATEHGKILVMVDGSTGIRYPARSESDFWQWTAAKQQAGREWDEIRERNVRSQLALVASGAVTGRAPFGYRIAGERYAKRLEVFEPEALLVREVFRRVTEGEALRAVAEWLQSAQDPATGRSWDSSLIARMVECWTYAGRLERSGSAYGECPPVVTANELADAQAAKRSRRKGSKGGRPSIAPAMLIPECGECGSKMYRAGGSAGRGGRRLFYYTCQGSHRFSVTVELADRAVIGRLRAFRANETRDRLIAGQDYRGEIKTLERDRLQAMERGDKNAVMVIWAKIEDLEGRDVEPDRIVSEETGRTYGKMFTDMSRDETRAWLREHGWTAVLWPDGKVRIRTPLRAYDEG
jgi:DNA invertase Pin-like site-specific DNA recombinase